MRTHVSDRFDDERRPRPTEGVRILGAEEAQAALDAREPQPPTRRPEAERRRAPPRRRRRGRRDRLRGRPDCDAESRRRDADIELDLEGRRRPTRFPDEGPSWSASAAGDADPVRVDSATDRRARCRRCRTGPNRPPARCRRSSPTTRRRPTTTSTPGRATGAATPRFRAEGADWADADFAEDDLTDETDGEVGALVGSGRRRRRRGVRTRPRARRRTPRGRAARTMATAAATAGAARRDAATPGRRRRLRPRSRRRPATAGPRPPDRARHRGASSSSSRCSASRRARSPRRRAGGRDRRRRHARVHRRAASARASARPTLLALDRRADCCRSRRASTAPTRTRCSSGWSSCSRCSGSCGRSRPAARCSASRRRCSRSPTSAGSAGSRACCSRSPTASA